MRDIKFRYRIKNIRTEEIEKPILSLDEIQSGSYKYLFCKYYIVLSRDQFSERYDKNGKEVYEGDWVEIKNPKCQVQKAILQGVVVFRYGSFGVEIKKVMQWDGYSKHADPPEIMWFLNLVNNKEIEIIDNEFENPELKI